MRLQPIDDIPVGLGIAPWDTPFNIPLPLIVSFSGGRSSGRMLAGVLAHNSPKDVVINFCNTGKEHEATLQFVNAVDRYYGAGINWLEWAPNGGWKKVSFETASRNGEPFRAMCERVVTKRRDGTSGRPPLPTRMTRMCTSELKIKLSTRFTKQGLGILSYNNAIGYRADESHRVHKAPAKHNRISGVTLYAPMWQAGIEKEDVNSFWATMPFDLQLPQNDDAYGNCDLCFLKGLRKIEQIIRADPARADFWIEMEERAARSDRPGPFRNDRPTYREIKEYILAGEKHAGPDFDDETTCASNGCTD